VAVTGIAGTGGYGPKPDGLVCFGVATESAERTETAEFGAIGRAQHSAATVEHALRQLLARLAG
ncbi:CinA family protein, partial [Paracoccus sp. (in: a-proteobacteria)]|uniref:CinA family protein n=1 Tax=Paracoccus sp. TaxID=267 RepID=UPI003A878691